MYLHSLCFWVAWCSSTKSRGTFVTFLIPHQISSSALAWKLQLISVSRYSVELFKNCNQCFICFQCKCQCSLALGLATTFMTVILIFKQTEIKFPVFGWMFLVQSADAVMSQWIHVSEPASDINTFMLFVVNSRFLWSITDCSCKKQLSIENHPDFYVI